jgi:hypothetical protein
MRFTLAAASVTSLAGLVVLAACSSDSSSSPNDNASSSGTSGTTPTVTVAACKSRCSAKLDGCGAPAAQSESRCTQLCGPGLSESQVTCLEGKGCEELKGSKSAEELCPTGSGSTSGGTSSSGSTSGGLPTSLTITGKFGTGRDATHTMAGGKVVSIAGIRADNPTLGPETSTLPNLAGTGISVKVDSPAVGGCAAKFTFTLNSAEVSVDAEGTDEGAAKDCGNFTDDIMATGFKATLSNVPYPNGSTKATVKLDLKP